MKIGDTVRFLNEVGGGKVKGFKDKNIVLVEDQDGFEIPMLITEVVAVETNENNFVRKPTAEKKKSVPVKEEPEEKPITFKPKPLERRGGELINLYLSFLPVEIKEISTTSFEAYLVNDSNYYMQVLYMSAEGANWHTRFNSVVEPNSKIFVEEFDRSMLNDIERVCIQAIVWKQDKPFALKPAYSKELRLDLTKFYKLHTFYPNEFFHDPNWTIPVIRDDKPARNMFVDGEKQQENEMKR